MLDVCAFPPSSKRAALADGPHSIRETDVQTQGQLSKTILTWTHTQSERETHALSTRPAPFLVLWSVLVASCPPFVRRRSVSIL